MPLLQHVVQELDRELARLQSLRQIVAGLSRMPAIVRKLTEAAPLSVAAPVVAQIATPSRKRMTTAGHPRERRVKKPVPEARALANTVPSGPVVFYPGRAVGQAAAARPTRVDPAPEPTHSQEELDAQSRALAARWATGTIQ